MDKFETLKLKKIEDILYVKINRPKRANAVSRSLLQDLIDLSDQLQAREDIQYIVLQGGDKVFSSGADLRDSMLEGQLPNSRSLARSWQRLGQEAIRKLESLEQIVICELKGSAYGAGAALAITADFIVMSEKAVINLPETRLGYFLTFGCTPRLVALVGMAKAKEMIMFAEDVPAIACKDFGLVHSVVEVSSIGSEVGRLINRLRLSDYVALRVTKKLIASAAAVTFGDILISESEIADGVIGLGRVQDNLEKFINKK